MEFKEPLIQGQFYHIFNRGNNGIDLFFDNESYYYFLRLYEKYIDPIADTYAWCLLKNHFHILVYLKLDSEINTSNLSYNTTDKPKVINPTNQFSHLFNAYTQAINKKFKRTGSLFEKRFERRKIENVHYFKNVIYYIHNNPVQHRFCEKIQDYPWSSYGSIVSIKPTKVKREKVLEFFNSKEEFKIYHTQKNNLFNISDLLIDY